MFIIACFLLISWILIGSTLRYYGLEKESFIFLLTYFFGIYIIVSIKDIYLNIRIFSFNGFKYIANFEPIYFNNFLNNNLILNKINNLKIDRYLKSKEIISNNSLFFNAYFLALELSMKKHEAFYLLLPVQSNHKYFLNSNLDFKFSDILNILRNTLSDIDLKEVLAKEHELMNEKSVSINELTSILFRLSKNYIELKNEVQNHYYSYHKNKKYYITLFLSVSYDDNKNDIFPFVLFLENRKFTKLDFSYLHDELNEFYNPQYTSFVIENYFNSKLKKITELEHFYLPLNFMKEIKDSLRDNHFIDSLLNTLNYKTSITPGFIDDNFHIFKKQMNDLIMFNNLELNLTKKEHHSSKKIAKL